LPARFFVDENDLTLGRALDDEHGNVVSPSRRWFIPTGKTSQTSADSRAIVDQRLIDLMRR